MRPAIFLDRDGVIIENRTAYIRSWDDVHIFPQALNALARLQSSPYKIVIVTNQSVVGRGLISLQAAWEINRQLIAVIERAGGRIDQVYLCPHIPEDECTCRKPKPGLILQAARELSLDLSHSILIGDTLSDLQAGRLAGVKQVALVRTGLGATLAQSTPGAEPRDYPAYDTLADALAELVKIET